MARQRNGEGVPRMITCEISGAQFEYMGYGRPPKYHPDVAKDVARKRRMAAYVAKQATKGKSVRHKAAYAIS